MSGGEASGGEVSGGVRRCQEASGGEDVEFGLRERPSRGCDTTITV